MALELQFSFKESADQLSQVFSDLTGVYNATTNLGGYGSPNPTTASLTYTNIAIQMMGETTVYNFPNIVGLPDSVSTDTYPILYSSFGGRRNGIFHVTYSVGTSSSNIVSSQDYYFAFIGGIICCLRKLRQSIQLPTSPCDCDNDELTSITNAWSLAEALCSLTTCDDLDGVQCVINYLSNFCLCSGCK